MTRLCLFVALAALLPCLRAASADPDAGSATPGADIAWQAPRACPTRGEFAALVARHADLAPDAQVRIHAAVRRKGRGFRMTLRIESQMSTGERRLDASSCDELAQAAALIIALAVQPPLVDEADAPGTDHRDVDAAVVRVHDSETPPRIALDRRPRDAAAQAPDRRGIALLGLPFDLVVRVMMSSDSGMLPETAPGVHASLAAQHDRFRVELGGGYVFEQAASMPDDPATGATISLAAASLRGCVEVYRGPALASVCAGGEVGRFSSTGYGSPESLARTQLHAAIYSGAAAAVAIRDAVHVRVDAGVAGMLIRPRFTACPVGTVEDCVLPLETFWQPEAAVLRVLAGVEMYFR